MCPAGGGRWDEDSRVASPDGGSASDSGDGCQPQRYRGSPQEPSRAHTIKEEHGGLRLHTSVVAAPAGAVEGLPGVSTPRFSSEYCPGSLAQTALGPGLGRVTSPAPSPLPGSQLSSPGSEHLHQPTDPPPPSLPLHHPFVRHTACAVSPSSASVLCPSHSYPRPYLDKHAYSLTGYAPEQLYDPENLRGHCAAANGPTHSDRSPHLRVAAEQSPGHKGPSVIITNGS